MTYFALLLNSDDLGAVGAAAGLGFEGERKQNNKEKLNETKYTSMCKPK